MGNETSISKPLSCEEKLYRIHELSGQIRSLSDKPENTDSSNAPKVNHNIQKNGKIPNENVMQALNALSEHQNHKTLGGSIDPSEATGRDVDMGQAETYVPNYSGDHFSNR